MAGDNSVVAPVYRYFTADLMSNDVLMEIPFRNVTWERALKAGGEFQGEISVIDATSSLNLYETTMPGQTALYVVRNGVCVWGGIIWARDYQIPSRNLSVSASEFTSYFHHRNIFKTLNYKYSTGVVVQGGTCYGLLDYEASSALKVGASIKMEFYEPENFRYNGYYRIDNTLPQSDTEFSASATITSKITATHRANGLVTVSTSKEHNLTTGDLVTITGTRFDGTFEITAPAGRKSTYFTYTLAGGDAVRAPASGMSSRTIPDAKYSQVTVSVHTDTYDYVRNLVESVFSDFTNTDYANDYLRPGIEKEISVVNKRLSQGFATIITDEPHELAVGQSVIVENTDPRFDGQFEVVQTPDENTFMYEKGGTVASTPVTPLSVSIVSRALGNFIATVTTKTPHGYRQGQIVNVDGGSNMDGMAGIYSGTFEITDVLSATKFSYRVSSNAVSNDTLLPNARLVSNGSTYRVIGASSNSSEVTFVTDRLTDAAVGSTFQVADVNLTVPLTQTTTDAAADTQTFTTAVPHPYQVGDTVKTRGVRSSVRIDSLKVSQGAASDQYNSRINLFANPSGRNDTRFLSTLGGATGLVSTSDGTTVTVNTAQAAETAGIRIDSITSSDTQARMNTLVPYIASAWVKGTPSMGVKLTVSNYEYITRDVSIEEITSSRVGWTRQYVSFVADKTPSVADFSVVNEGPLAANSGMTISYRDGQLENTNNLSPTPWFSSTTPAAGILEYGSVTLGGFSVAVEKSNGSSGGTVTFTTSPAHGITTDSSGYVFYVRDLVDSYTPKSYSITNNIVNVQLTTPHNMLPGDSLQINNVSSSYGLSSRSIEDNVATFTTGRHPFSVNDTVTLVGLTEKATIVSKEIQKGTAILVTGEPHNIQVSQEIKVTGLGSPYDSVSGVSTVVTAVTPTRIMYRLRDSRGNDLVNADAKPTKANGSVTSTTSVLNGTFTVIGVPSSTSIQVGIVANNSTRYSLNSASSYLKGASPINGAYSVLGVPSTTRVTFYKEYDNVSSTDISNAISTVYPNDPKPTLAAPSPFNGLRNAKKVGRYAITVNIKGSRGSIPDRKVPSGSIYQELTGDFALPITAVPTDNSFTVGWGAVSSSVETYAGKSAYASSSLLNGTYTVTKRFAGNKLVARLNSTHNPIPYTAIGGQGSAVVQPRAIVSTFGSFPGNTDLGINFSSQSYSGKDVDPVAYRGHELTNVGDALDAYSGTVDGFEYRIDCAYDEDTGRFTRTFVLIPIDFPDAPPAGQASPPSRFGADKLVFEYPGSVIDIKLEESAEDSATRFFVVGDSGLGGEAANPFSAASAIELLDAKNSRKWPLLDATESVSDISDETVLYAYAAQYLKESRPPEPNFTVTVNGSLQPEVPTYVPGDWCSVIVDDMFLQERLASNLEPRDTVIVRKIDSYKVKVPDGTTFPETVTLNLVAETDVDKVS
jgi:hypothetical protein